MRRRRQRSLGESLARGLVAGVAGTAAMTAYQLLVAKLRGEPLRTSVPESWDEAPAPARVAHEALDGLVGREQAPLLTNAMHWLYGVSWGVAYGIARRHVAPRPAVAGPAFGAGLWALSYALLPPLGIYEPPWRYPPGELALDLSYHVVYGAGVAGAYAALPRQRLSARPRTRCSPSSGTR